VTLATWWISPASPVEGRRRRRQRAIRRDVAAGL